jgi:high affinity sulfate transporter 1
VTATADAPARGWARFTPGVARLRHYDRAWLRFDVVAGVTVAAYLIPQCMAYAEIAGLSPVVGLWAVLPPMLIYAVFGSSGQLSVGPESTTAIMTASAVAPLVATSGDDYAALCAFLALLVGAVCIVAFVARLGFLANLLSRPILVGYLAGVALIMMVGQLEKVTGIEIEADGFFREVWEFLGDLDEIHGPTALLALGVVVFLFLVQHWFPKLPGPLLAVVLSLVVVSVFDLTEDGISVVGPIPAGLPTPALPDIGWSEVATLLPAALGIALVGFSDNVLTARAFAGRAGTGIDANQELLALGASNVGTGLFQGFPISSSGSRTVIGDSLGSKTQLYSIVGFATVVFTLLFLRPVLEDFPNAALGALVIFAAIKLIEIPEFRALLAFERSEFVIAVATTLGVLVTDILMGVVIAIGLSILELLTRIARPHDAILGKVPGQAGWHDIDDWDGATTIPGLVLYRYDAPIFFANIDDFTERALASLKLDGDARWFVLQTEAVARVDSTAVEGLRTLIGHMQDEGVTFCVAECKQDLYEQLDRAGLVALIGPDRIFPTTTRAVRTYNELFP